MSREKAKKHRVVRATERPLSVSNENRIGCWYKLAFALVGDRAAKNKVGVKVSVKGKRSFVSSHSFGMDCDLA